jgi:hypothetical protein
VHKEAGDHKMRKHKKWTALILALVMVLVYIPVGSAQADLGDIQLFKATIECYGSDPTPVTVYLLEQDGTGAYQITHTWTATPDSFSRENKSFSASVQVEKAPVSKSNLAFFAVSRNDLNGKWYCDKWDWNNLLYQPGAYAIHDGVEYNFAHFYLTSSLETNNSITINRQWETEHPDKDIYFDIFRYSPTMNKYYPWTGATITAGNTSATVSGLYDGTYYAVQSLPEYTTDNANFTFQFQDPADHNFYTYKGLKADLSGGTNASVVFNDNYNPPPSYNVNIGSLTGGTIAADTTTAKEGDTVNLTVTPDTEMQLKSGTLKYNDGSDHTISGTSFTMPAGAVTVSAVFEAKHYNVSIGSLTGGSITANPTNLVAGQPVSLTITPNTGKKLKDNTLQYKYGSTTAPITGTSFNMPKADVTVSGTFETPVSISTASLPEGMESVPYSATLAAQDGTTGYTWIAGSLPDGLALNASTGVISGMPTGYGNTDIKFTVTDGNGETASKTLSLYLNAICGNGGYLITPDADIAYTAGATTGGLPTLTVNSTASGFKYLSVTIKKEKGHAGSEVLLFTQTRGGQQIAMTANYADYDTITSGKAAFNVRPGDVITACIVDALSNDAGVNPTIL